MSRYVFTYTLGPVATEEINQRIKQLEKELKYLRQFEDGGLVEYMESTPEEDDMDVDDNGDAYIDFTGNGYLHFWTRCKKQILKRKLKNGVGEISDNLVDDVVVISQPTSNKY